MNRRLPMVVSGLGREMFLWALFTDQLLHDGIQRMYTRSWDTDVATGRDWAQLGKLKEELTSLYVNENLSSVEIFAAMDGGLFLYITMRRAGGLTVTIGSPEERQEEAQKRFGWLEKIYPRATVDDPRSVRMKFWMNTSRGPQSNSRTIQVPAWEEIVQNYAQDTGQVLSSVMSGFKPAHGGQLILWHGKPGTGKTFALRALALHWREWCTVECVVDPEVFFGDAHYMMSVLLDNEDDEDDMLPDIPATADEGGKAIRGTAPGGRWRLLILEDAGELLAEDARDRTGQGLSRMLNLTDGLIGQGMRALILVTTNEPLKKMHPAVARPGRCASEVEFKTFDRKEADRWLAARGVTGGDLTLTDSKTLADLYGQVEKFTSAHGATTERVGFRR